MRRRDNLTTWRHQLRDGRDVSWHLLADGSTTVSTGMYHHLRPFKPSRCIKASFYIPENRLNFTTTKGFRTKIYMKLFYRYMAIFFNFSPTSNHFHPLQVENCDGNLWLVVDEDHNGKFKLERVKLWLKVVETVPGCGVCWVRFPYTKPTQ